jgi:hypothetical protein
VLAAQAQRDLRRETAKHLVARIDHVPVVLDVLRLCRIRFHSPMLV